MGVVGHAAEGVNTTAKGIRCILEETVEFTEVPITGKNIRAIIATKDDVIKCARDMKAWFSWHGEKLPRNVRISSLTRQPQT